MSSSDNIYENLWAMINVFMIRSTLLCTEIIMMTVFSRWCCTEYLKSTREECLLERNNRGQNRKHPRVMLWHHIAEKNKGSHATDNLLCGKYRNILFNYKHAWVLMRTRTILPLKLTSIYRATTLTQCKPFFLRNWFLHSVFL